MKIVLLIETNTQSAMFTPYSFEDENYYMRLSEYQDLSIRNKKTGKSHSVNLVTELIDDEDLS